MKPTTAIYKKLTCGGFVAGRAPVDLDGEPVGYLERDGRYIRCRVYGRPGTGAGLSTETALRSFAVHLWLNTWNPPEPEPPAETQPRPPADGGELPY